MVYGAVVHYFQINVEILTLKLFKNQVFKNELGFSCSYLVDICGKVEGKLWCI